MKKICFLTFIALLIPCFASPVRWLLSAHNTNYADQAPLDIVEVEWLQGDGASFFNLNLFCKYGMVFEVKYLPTANDTWSVIAGVKSIASIHLTLGAISSWSYYGSSYIGSGIGTKSTVYWQDSLFSSTTRRCQSTQGSFTYYWNPTRFAGQINSPLYLFACNTKDTTVTEFFRGKISYFRISDDNGIIIDLVPVRIGEVGCMYDLVSGKIFRNQGTGAFIVGPDK